MELKVGATVIPISASATQREIEIIQDFQSTIITCTSYAPINWQRYWKRGH